MIFQLEDSDDNIKIIYQNSHLWDPIQFNYNAKTIKSAVASLYQIYTHYLSNHQSIDFSLDQIYFDGHQYLILDYGLDYEFFAEMCIGGADVSKVYQATMAPEML